MISKKQLLTTILTLSISCSWAQNGLEKANREYDKFAYVDAIKSYERIAKKESPKIADLVFFSDTLEKTKRKVGAENITHIGIVTQVDRDGTVHFIHNIRGKNVIGVLNEKYVNKLSINLGPNLIDSVSFGITHT